MSLRLGDTRTASRSSLLSLSTEARWLAYALADRDDWVSRVTAAGGSVSSGTQAAVLTFCQSIYSAGLRSSFLRLNLFCGSNLAASLVPLFRASSYSGAVVGNASDTNVNFVSGDYSESTGLKGNGSSKYLNTGVTPLLLPDRTSFHLAGSGAEFSTNTNTATLVGTWDGTAAGLYTLESSILVSSSYFAAFRSGTTSSYPSVASSATESHLVGTRTTRNAAALYRGGSSVSTNTTAVSPSITTRNFLVFASSTSTGVSNYSPARMTSYSIGGGLTAAQVSAYSTALIAFNTALGR